MFGSTGADVFQGQPGIGDCLLDGQGFGYQGVQSLAGSLQAEQAGRKNGNNT